MTRDKSFWTLVVWAHSLRVGMWNQLHFKHCPIPFEPGLLRVSSCLPQLLRHENLLRQLPEPRPKRQGTKEQLVVRLLLQLLAENLPFELLWFVENPSWLYFLSSCTHVMCSRASRRTNPATLSLYSECPNTCRALANWSVHCTDITPVHFPFRIGIMSSAPSESFRETDGTETPTILSLFSTSSGCTGAVGKRALLFDRGDRLASNSGTGQNICSQSLSFPLPTPAYDKSEYKTQWFQDDSAISCTHLSAALLSSRSSSNLVPWCGTGTVHTFSKTDKTDCVCSSNTGSTSSSGATHFQVSSYFSPAFYSSYFRGIKWSIWKMRYVKNCSSSSTVTTISNPCLPTTSACSRRSFTFHRNLSCRR